MKPSFEELDSQDTRLGELSLRRRHIRSLNDIEVYEIKLDQAYLMSSLFHEAEVALADIGLGELEGNGWEVIVGGLGLGYTAAAALKFRQLRRLIVVEALAPVIDWHERGLLTPLGKQLRADTRCTFCQADFFALSRSDGFDQATPGFQFDAILLDIDHSPNDWLHPNHGGLYTQAGLMQLNSFLKPHGVFALWSNDPPEDVFLNILSQVFVDARGHTIRFENPLQQSTSANGIYVAHRS